MAFHLTRFFMDVHLLPLIFIYLWTLIIFDVKNFRASRKAYTEYTAKDPINCYTETIQMPPSAINSPIKNNLLLS